jgi:multicomponent Na+:H+ antiporter subunit E
MGQMRSVPGTEQGAAASPRAPHWRQTVALFLMLALFWFLLSGRIGIPYFLSLTVSVWIVLRMNPERPLDGLDPSRGEGVSGLIRGGAFFLRYLAWLFWNMVKANLQVAWIILHPGLPVDPTFLVFRTTLKSDLSRVLLANSITLTPGTITVDLKDDQLLVHALAPATAGALTKGELQNVVGAVFGEAPGPAPEVTWTATYRELGE